MAVNRIDAIDDFVSIVVKDDLSPAAQSAAIAAFARQAEAEADEVNTSVLGYIPEHDTTVDGVLGALEDNVKPNGQIVYDFKIDLLGDMFAWIDQALIRESPVGSGRDKHPGLYQKSQMFFADGVEADPLQVPSGILVGTFVNAVPYARKVESGESPQFPDGVYEVVTAQASRRFGNIAKIQLGYRAIDGAGVATGLLGNKSAGRNPAIIITVK